MAAPLRLWQALARAGLGRRKQVLALISSGQVRVNDQLASPLQLLAVGDVVTLDGNQLSLQSQPLLLMYHKPVGVDCNIKGQDSCSISTLLAQLPAGLFPVGRLDKDSAGLLLLTNRGDLAQRLLHPQFAHEKEYALEVTPQPATSQLAELAKGPAYQRANEWIEPRPCQISQVQGAKFHITITEGRYRQIRFMCKAVGLQVQSLTRVRMQSLWLGDLPVGEWRELSTQETTELLQTLSFDPIA